MSWLVDKINWLVNNINLNLFLIVMMAITLSTGLHYYSRIRYINQLLNRQKTQKEKTKKKEKPFSKLQETLRFLLVLKNKESKLNSILASLLVIFVAVFAFFIKFENVFLAISVPIIMYFMTCKILEEMIVDFDLVVKKNFSNLVNHMIKHFAKTNDLSIVLYESSKEVEDPLRSLLLTLSREIIVTNNQSRIIEFIEKTDNLWLHSFLLTLVNYKETSSKENVINNLLELSSMVDKRNELSSKMVSDRKPVVIINYMLLVVGIAIFIGNIILNPIMKEFMGTPFGIVCVLIGVTAMFLTVLMNMKLVKQ